MSRPKSKRKHSTHHAHQPRPIQPALDRRQEGLHAFRAGRFDAAITAWSELASGDVKVTSALAEAYFRHALASSAPAGRRADLQQAASLVPEDPRYRYHLGLALHRAGDLPGAVEQYRTVLQRDAGWAGAGMVLALALLEQDARTDIAALPGNTPAVRAALAPVQALLRGEAPTPAGADPLATLWHGLGLIPRGDGSAREALADSRSLPAASAAAARRYYEGVAAAQADDMHAAARAWQRAVDGRLDRPWLWNNLAAVLPYNRGEQLAPGELGDIVAALEHAFQHSGGGAALGDLLVQTLDGAGHAAAMAGDWAPAVELWEKARQVVGSSSGLGSPRPLLRNLALAYEALERWLDAAEAWRALLRTQPRKARRSDEASRATPVGQMTDEQWIWVRKRVIECYKNAGAPEEAVTLFRQAVKADPNDLDMRLQLVDALLANEQEQAASNELQRILQIAPHQVDAQLRFARVKTNRGEWNEALSLLRGVLARQPEREDARRQLAELLLDYGHDLHDAGQHARAAYMLEEGRELAPGDFRFPLYLARVVIDQRKLSQARPLLERVLELANGQPNIYVNVIECWLVAKDVSAAHAAIARAEAELVSPMDFYLDLTTMLLTHGSMPMGLGLLGLGPKAPAKPANSPWSDLAMEVLGRAVALRPDDPELRRKIAATLMIQRPDLALSYAEEAVRMAPDDPDSLLLLAMALGFNDRSDEARQTARRAGQLARRQGRPDVARRADEISRQVGSPLFRLSFGLARIFDDAGFGPDNF